MDTSYEEKIADSFSPEAIAKLKEKGIISDEVANAALELLKN